MFLSEWREFPSTSCLAEKKTLMTPRVSMLLKSRASPTCFRACFLPGRPKDLSASVSVTYPHQLCSKNQCSEIFPLFEENPSYHRCWDRGNICTDNSCQAGECSVCLLQRQCLYVGKKTKYFVQLFPREQDSKFNLSVSSERLVTSTNLHGVISQKTTYLSFYLRPCGSLISHSLRKVQ